MNRGREPAYPLYGYGPSVRGLTIREHFAGQMMAARLNADPTSTHDYTANIAVDAADALLAALAAEHPAAAPAQPVLEKLEAALHSLYDYGCEERLPSSNSLAFAKEALEEAGAAP